MKVDDDDDDDGDHPVMHEQREKIGCGEFVVWSTISI